MPSEDAGIVGPDAASSGGDGAAMSGPMIDGGLDGDGGPLDAGAPIAHGRIVFHAQRGGDMEVFTMAVDGTDVRRLTNAPGRDLEPSWSPDGRSIVFVSGRNAHLTSSSNSTQLFLMNADGSEPRAVTPIDDHILIGPRFTPDGQWIVFHSNAGPPQPLLQIYKVRPNGTDMTNLSGGVVAAGRYPNDFRPVVTPDGDRIVFTSERDATRELYVMNLDGSAQRRLTMDDWDDNEARTSPDGRALWWTSHGRQNPMIPGSGGSSARIWMIPIDASLGAALVPLSAPKPVIADLAIWDLGTPAISPSGDWIVFRAKLDTRPGSWDLYKARTDGSELTRLTFDESYNGYPDWIARAIFP